MFAVTDQEGFALYILSYVYIIVDIIRPYGDSSMQAFWEHEGRYEAHRDRKVHVPGAGREPLVWEEKTCERQRPKGYYSTNTREHSRLL